MELDVVIRLNRKVRALGEKIRRLKETQQSLVPVIDGMPKSRGRGTSRLEDLATRIMTLEEELNAVADALIASAVDLAFEIIERVPYPMTDILIMRYVGLKKFKQIVSTSGYTEPHVYYLHAQGVKVFKAAS